MKIHSRFKDYYDYVAQIYGGGDPNIIYNRERVVAAHVRDGQLVSEGEIGVPQALQHYIPMTGGSRWERNFKPVIDHRGLAVAGRWYRLEQHSHVSQETGVMEVVRPWAIAGPAPEVESTSARQSIRNAARGGRYIPGVFSPKVVELSRLVNAPVFIVTGYGWGQQHVQGRVPNLGELGLAKYLSAEQCYQEIAMFLGNTILVNPDEAPESKPPLTNEEKALSHGFDKKQSFRHRK